MIELEYTTESFVGTHRTSDSVENFVHSAILGYRQRDRVHLEDQPKKVLEVVSRLLEFLMNKNLLSLEEFHDILLSDRYTRSDVTLKKEDGNEL